MESREPEIAHEVLPYLRVYKDGTVQRLAGTDVVPPEPHNRAASSKDIVISEHPGISARIYRPAAAAATNRKLPLIVYFHGGAFCISSPADPPYHRSLTAMSAAANAVVVNVGYRKAPEHPLPAAYDDARAALRWVSSHSDGGGREEWIRDGVDFGRVFLAGDSAGANIAHHLAMRPPGRAADPDLEIRGIVMIHPYFWGEEPIGSEREEPGRKAMVDAWWRFVCPRGCDDPWINPFAEGAPDLAWLGCDRVLVCVAEKDILRERGRLYYESLAGSSGWRGTAEMAETPGEDHVFHIFDPDGEKAVEFFKRLASFINQ